MSIEIRSFTSSENIDATDEGIIFGLAIPYNRTANIGDPKQGGFEERIAPGACTKSIREADIVALYNHDPSRPLGRTSAGNLKLANTTRGIEPELKPSDVSYARDLSTLVKDKVIRGWSFGFEVVKDDWFDDKGEPSDQWTGTQRTIREMKLIEVSPVTFPAYDQTEISSRSAILDAREERAKAAAAEAPPETGEPAQEEKRAKNKTPYGAGAKYADPGYQPDKVKRYPLNTLKRIKAAWAYINMPKNAKKYSASQLSAIKGRIRSAAKKAGVKIAQQNAADMAMEWRVYLSGYKPRTGLPDAEEGAVPERKKITKGTVKRIAEVDVLLKQALDLMGQADVKSLPPEAQQAAALVSSACIHVGHIAHTENITPADALKGREQDAGSAEKRDDGDPKPGDEPTSASVPDDAALLAAYAAGRSRQFALNL